MSFTLTEFLAHAIAMEEEAAERYLELADMMEAHNNLDVSRVFRDMNHYSQLHRDSIQKRVGALQLPELKSWQYRWTSPPEVGDEDGFDYMMEPYHALEYARENERRAMAFYQSAAEAADDPELKSMATEFAKEEQEHTEALDKWLDMTLRP
jgi:rubrerythrin